MTMGLGPDGWAAPPPKMFMLLTINQIIISLCYDVKVYEYRKGNLVARTLTI
jgi:hypothetical protein